MSRHPRESWCHAALAPFTLEPGDTRVIEYAENLTDFFNGGDKKGDELVAWFGKRVTVEMEAF